MNSHYRTGLAAQVMLACAPANVPIQKEVLDRAKVLAKAVARLSKQGYQVDRASLCLGSLDKPAVTISNNPKLRKLVATGKAMNDACGTDEQGPWQRYHYDLSGCRVSFVTRGH